MNGGKKDFRLVALLTILFLIAAGTVVYELGPVGLSSSYAESPKNAGKKIPAGKPGAGEPVSAEGISVVAIVKSGADKASDLEYAEIRRMVEEAVTLAGGFEGLIRNGRTVVLKPNLVTPIDYTLPGWNGRPLSPYANGTTTDFRVTRAVVELVRRYNPDGKIYVMEGSAFPTRRCMVQLNYTPEHIPGVDEFICIEEDSGAWGDKNSRGIVKVPVKDPLLVKDVYMNRKYREADVVISLPVLKTHWTEIVSGSVKNVGIGATPATIYGGRMPGMTNRTPGIDHDKAKLDMWIHDWFMARPVDFTVMDGLQGIQNGPTPCFEMTGATSLAPDQMNSRLVLAGRDCVAVDTIESLVMQWDPRAVGYLGYLERSGAGHSDVSGIRVVGKQADDVRQNFRGTSPEGKFTDLTPPQVVLGTIGIDAGRLTIGFTTDSDAAKAEVYADGEYRGTAALGGGECSLQAGGFEHLKFRTDVMLAVYDRYLNRTETRFRLVNDPAAGIRNAVLPMDDGFLSVPRAEEGPAVDGDQSDACWSSAGWKDLKYAWGGTRIPDGTDFSGRCKLVWTPEALFLLAEIRDDVLVDSHPDPLDRYWEDDTLEVFIDEDASGGEHTMDYNAFAYHVALDGRVVDYLKAGSPKPGLLAGHVECRRKDAGGISVWEAVIRAYPDSYDEKEGAGGSVVLSAGKRMGFALAYCDSDGATRESFVGSLPMPDGQDYGWRNADSFGTITLTE